MIKEIVLPLLCHGSSLWFELVKSAPSTLEISISSSVKVKSLRRTRRLSHEFFCPPSLLTGFEDSGTRDISISARCWPELLFSGGCCGGGEKPERNWKIRIYETSVFFFCKQDLTIGYLFLVAKMTSLDERSRNKTTRYTWRIHSFTYIHTYIHETSEFCNILASEPLTSIFRRRKDRRMKLEDTPEGGFNSKKLHQTSWKVLIFFEVILMLGSKFICGLWQKCKPWLGEYNNSIRTHSLCTCEEQQVFTHIWLSLFL